MNIQLRRCNFCAFCKLYLDLVTNITRQTTSFDFIGNKAFERRLANPVTVIIVNFVCITFTTKVQTSLS